MKRNLNSSKNKNKLTLNKQTIRELKPLALEDSAGGLQAHPELRRPPDKTEPC